MPARLNKILQYGSLHRQVPLHGFAFYARYLWCGRLAERAAQSLNMPSENRRACHACPGKDGDASGKMLTAEYLNVSMDEVNGSAATRRRFTATFHGVSFPSCPNSWLEPSRVPLGREARFGLGRIVGVDDH